VSNRTSLLPVASVVVAVGVAAVTALTLGVFGGGGKHSGMGTWSTYMGGLARTGFAAQERSITPANVHSLKQRWLVPGTATISSQVTFTGGRLYWGSWDGYEHATDPITGEDVWHTFIGDETKKDCVPPHAGVTSTAAVGFVRLGERRARLLFVGGGDGSVYALLAATGKIVWSRNFGSPQQGWFIWSSPALYRGSVYVGIGSIGDCPLVPGAVVKLDAATGATQARFATVAKGCAGATVWSSPTIDAATGTVYVTTGNAGGTCTKHEPYAESMLQLSASSLTLEGSWRTPRDQRVPDSDFGATPTLFQARIHGKPTKLVGAASKNGIYYAFRRNDIAAGPVWESARISSAPETIASSAWDGVHLYVAGQAARLGGRHCAATIRAIDPSTGRFAWQDCVHGGTPNAALTSVPGLVFESAGSVLYGLDASDGDTLFMFQDTSFNWFFAPATVADGTLYIGNSDGKLYALSPGGH
jgi:polyvinyl alcohol dehydrogenase (cytochrome)